jgi:hypothetical protein
MLWWLAVLAPLVALYLLRVRPTRKPTTALFLWLEFFSEKKSTALLRRLRNLFSLLLMLLALTAIALAMGKPTLESARDTRGLILLIDTSVSMSAADGGATRLARARDLAVDIVESLGINRRAAVATVAHDIRYVVDLTNNQRALIRGIRQIRPSDFAFRSGVLDALGSDAGGHQPCRVILLSDGCFAGADAMGSVELLKVGRPAENVGIVGFDLMRLPGDPPRLGLYFQLASSFKQNKDVNVLLCHGPADEVVKVCPVTVAGGLSKPETFVVDNPRPGRWTLKLDMTDAMDKDNTAYAVVPEPDPIRAAVRARKGSFFMRRCVEAFGKGRNVMTLTDERPEVVLTTGKPDVTPLAGTYIIFGPTGTSPFWRQAGPQIDPGPVRALLPEHPAVRFCNLEAVDFTGQRRITPPPGAVVLAAAHDGNPLIYRTAAGQARAYVINMDPVAGEFFLSAHFPVMVYSMAVDLTGKHPRRDVSLRPGQPLPLRSGQAPTVTDPAGLQVSFKTGAVPQAEKLGFYRVSYDSETRWFACSLAEPRESLLGNSAVRETAGPVGRGTPLGVILIVAALLLAALECALYHRRRVG